MKTKRVKTDTFCVFNCKYSVIIWLSSFFECRTFLFMNFFSKIHHLPTTWTNHPVVFLLFSFENKLQSWQSTLKVNDISTSIFFSNAIKYMINLICFLLLESLLFYIFHLKITNINTCYQWARHTYPRTGVPSSGHTQEFRAVSYLSFVYLAYTLLPVPISSGFYPQLFMYKPRRSTQSYY